ncbi:NUDIX hydrolase [Cereibacter sphaeroides]|uniref:NUDIX domain-containing protein n=1 Tax=Cereibacter sphaeroides TaxID=1063 RepID=UPI001F4718C7|nr:NUDIX hydrolase [Cereibacter sphaeroides]MCE6958307.1 NUDIX hydrolase [Cereibacter sphaeroides]MCE6971917.1 NUDIX hydrolase [Cereibacter sphaeroides]
MGQKRYEERITSVTALVTAGIAADPAEEMHHREALEETGFWGRRGAGCLAVARDTGRILVALRSDEVLEPGTWGTWGGAIDPQEDPAVAVCREFGEETGYEGAAEVLPLMVFTSGAFRYHNFLLVVEHEFEPVLNWENSEGRWCQLQALPDPLHFGLASLLEDVPSRDLLERHAVPLSPEAPSC